MLSFAHTGLSLLADTSGAISVMRDYIRPTIQMLAGLASIACTLFLVHGGYLYMTSRGNPESLETAKRVVRNALIGLVIVLGAMTLTTILSGAYGNPSNVSGANLPNLQAIQPQDAGSGLVEVLIKAVTGFLNNIIQTIGAPFLSALDYFTKATPLMAENPGVFNLWLAVVGITDVLFILIVALMGFHVMSAASLGFDEIEFKHLLPRIGLAFLLVNTSIFVIDFVIQLSNVLITAITKVTGATSVWVTLTAVVKESGGQSAAALLVMIAFLIFSVILLIYYVGRLVVLFLGAVLSPLVIAFSILPSFRDFSVTAVRTYVTTIFVLFVHVVTLELAATLFVGLSATDGNNGLPNVLMSMVIGLATVLTLLKTQGVMMQFGYVSLGARNARKLGSQFMNGVSYLTGKGQAAVSSVSSKASSGTASTASSKSSRSTTQTNTSYKQPKNMNTAAQASKNNKKMATGTTVEAPKVTPRSEATEAKLAKSKKEEK